MKKNNVQTKILVINVVTFVLAIMLMPILSNSVRAEARETELSAEDIKTLSYYQEPTLDMRFEDNEVWVILKSAYD